MNLQRAGERAEETAVDAQLFGRNLVASCESLVPATEHRERVTHLGERKPLVGTVTDPAREIEALLEIPERFCVSVLPEHQIREVGEGRARLSVELVRESLVQRELEERLRLLRSTWADDRRS